MCVCRERLIVFNSQDRLWEGYALDTLASYTDSPHALQLARVSQHIRLYPFVSYQLCIIPSLYRTRSVSCIGLYHIGSVRDLTSDLCTHCVPTGLVVVLVVLGQYGVPDSRPLEFDVGACTN